jgi:micrococcal nuclease
MVEGGRRWQAGRMWERGASGPGEAVKIAAGAACNPAYPTVCIPSVDDAGGGLGCRDIPNRRCVELPPDPHNFDGDGNGIGYEIP